MMRSALELAHLVKTKAVSPVEVAREFLAACDRRNPELNALVWRRDAELLEEAKAAEAQVMRGEYLGPFHGVPIPIKDLSETLGQPTTHGSLAAKEKLGRFDSSAVTQMRKAGFLFMGRSNSPEFGSLPVTENKIFGATRNPWNVERTPGGSSGGAAAMVAAGMAPIAHASDGGGSIRIPASCCGLVGLKPSRGRIPKGPWLSEILHGFSTDGCVSTTVADTAAMLDVLNHWDPNAWTGVQVPETPFSQTTKQRAPRVRIGYTITNALGVKPEQSCVDAVTKTATLLSELGFAVEEAKVKWPIAPDQLERDFLTLWATASAYVDFPDWSEVEPVNQELLAQSKAQSSHDYIKALIRLQLFSRNLLNAWGKSFDVLLTPTIAMEPPKIGWLFEGSNVMRRAAEMVPYSGWINVTGQPAISLPMHVAASGLPVGVQLVGAPWRDDLILQVARELEEAVHWRASLPV